MSTFILALFASSYASTFRVDPEGNGDFTNIQDAISAAEDGDTIQLAEGDYANVLIQNRRLSFVSLAPGLAKIGNWTIEGGSVYIKYTHFDHVSRGITTTGHVLLDSVSFGGSAPNAEQAVMVGNGGSVEMTSSKVSEFYSSQAPIYVGEGGLFVARDTVFEDNRGSKAGAIASNGGSVTLDGVLFTGNASSQSGGALTVAGGVASLESCGFDHNVSVIGGAIQATGAAQLSVTDAIFSKNQAQIAGGHIWVGARSDVLLNRVTMERGIAQSGAGVFMEDSTLNGTNLIIEDGEGTGQGGGIAAMSGQVNLGFTVFSRNIAVQGGAFYIGTATVAIDSSLVVNNQGGVSIDNSGGSLAVDYSLFWGPNADFDGRINLGTHVQHADPRFVSSHEYILSAQSPALDAGNRNFLDKDGTYADIGAFGGPASWDLPDMDGDGAVVGRDCNDEDPGVNLNAVETWYDGVDGNCDFANDYDQDGDGFVAAEFGGTDCDDTSPQINPDATEQPGDSGDVNCDGESETDNDGDGFVAGIDCNDKDASVYPGARDTWYDGIDSDCDGGSDWDADRDGYANGQYDCDDTNPLIYGGAPEIAEDGIDQDCSGSDLDLGSTTEETRTVAEVLPAENREYDQPEVFGCSSVGNVSGLGMLVGMGALLRRNRKQA